MRSNWYENDCYSHFNKIHFHKKGFALSLVLKVTAFGTRKWPNSLPVSLMKLPFISWHLLPVWQRGFCQSKTFLFPKTCNCLVGTLSSSVNALQTFVRGSAEISHGSVPTQFQLVINKKKLKKTYHYSFCMISYLREIGCLKAFTFYVPPPFEDPEVEKRNRNNVMWLPVLIAPPRTFCET